MKKFALILLAFIMLLVTSCSADKSNLLEISYDSQGDSNMTLESGEKLAYVKDSPKDAYAYLIKGYDSKDFLIVEDRSFMENTDVIYFRSDNGIKDIPGELVDIGPSPDMGEISFNNRTYYHFRDADPSFELGESLGEAPTLVYHSVDSNNVYTPLDEPKEVIAHLYAIPDVTESDWIAVQKENYSGNIEIYGASDADFMPVDFIKLP